MNIFFDSMTGNTRRLATRTQQLLRARGIEIEIGDIRQGDVPRGPYVLITHTFDRGGVPRTTQDFLARHSRWMQAVASSGTHNWGADFARAADTISTQFGVPMLAKINKSGSQQDVDLIAQWIIEQSALSIPLPEDPSASAGTH